MTTGDLRGCLRKLERQLRTLKYPREVDYCSLARGDLSSVLPIVSYAFVSYSSHVAEHLVELGVELAGKNDLRFVETVYKVLRDVFHYKPLLTKQQFLQPGFAEHKIGILCDVIGFVTRKHGQLCKVARPTFQKKSKSGFPSIDLLCKMEKLPVTDVVTSGTFSKLPLVEKHTGDTSSALTNPLCNEANSEAGSETSSEVEEPEAEDPLSPAWPTEPQVCPTPSLPLWQVMRSPPSCHARDPQVDEARLQALEAQLQECQAKLEKLSSLERRLQALERDTAGKVVVDREQWENLESRVLLLETRLALSSAQAESSILLTEKDDITSQEASEAEPEVASGLRGIPAGHQPPEASPISVTNVSKGTLKRLERIASMMKDTSCLLKCGDPSM
ncbi:centrosomal protein of 44 kDa isoform X1 [Brienomyrus brachyistius]|uniref:centrosomal protein of 44 kDa isoform X1 n=1 Tax=Brienomyrus brachyistius TaxID=42636 RepID=UPI0020B1CBD2|nr:centrosomal protein of 44 kDa isoform X1 [Brienomyrus brachyistius]XP_048852618.1 centrosomal protein of 44 kDa isoform X1 [Brienomyrus brachyistius]